VNSSFTFIWEICHWNLQMWTKILSLLYFLRGLTVLLFIHLSYVASFQKKKKKKVNWLLLITIKINYFNNNLMVLSVTPDSGDLLLASCSKDCFIRIWRISSSNKNIKQSSSIDKTCSSLITEDELKLTSNLFTINDQGDNINELWWFVLTIQKPFSVFDILIKTVGCWENIRGA